MSISMLSPWVSLIFNKDEFPITGKITIRLIDKNAELQGNGIIHSAYGDCIYYSGTIDLSSCLCTGRTEIFIYAEQNAPYATFDFFPDNIFRDVEGHRMKIIMMKSKKAIIQPKLWISSASPTTVEGYITPLLLDEKLFDLYCEVIDFECKEGALNG